ncbi:DNA helicase II [Lysinibacillus sphaericus]|uniref:UvrD-helicase domain-containing protein n=1 Tax=Lysinibacillus sphaericus TaxID=1421 RepID=UPI0018CC891E|nr:UvrD-helicase domain-containing protein [Lysinibacillus sphaericus]MBG9454981.1 DNA helicase II [Lysinibacillus sphaericus]MBG9478948.1 DNA helicase II [Lysinibacillus sphaericus]MBG9593355.1 DNA helicase II [Lysinibacillus sphaericus]
MIEKMTLNPAELAAKEALKQVYSCISQKKSFVLEAGAGAGKTYSLIHALKHMLVKEGNALLRNNQRIACITYTNIARNEIESRTDHHPVIFSATIHSFCWSIIKDYQPRLREILPQIDKWGDRLKEIGEINNHTITYDIGYSRIESQKISLSHNDVLALTICLMEDYKFRKIFSFRFPVIFIDEYQDTDKNFIESIKKHFLDKNDGPLFGFFGDHWQKIYGTGCGKIEHDSLKVIEKRANFRSCKTIVDSLNRIRPELMQEINDSDEGSVLVFHSNAWKKERRTEPHWKGDLPMDIAHQSLVETKSELLKRGWDFSKKTTKILMLTHNILAQEQGYRNIADVFPNNDSYIKKEDDYIAFFVNILEPVCIAYENKKFGQMFSLLEGERPVIRSHKEKLEWVTHMDRLISIRNNKDIGEVIEHLKKTRYPSLPEYIERYETELDLVESFQELDDYMKKKFERIKKLKTIPYQEVIALSKFIEHQTPFATKHGVKGAEFENVLVVFGRGWSHYNFSQMLEYESTGIPPKKIDMFERNRNLFYVACSRPKKRLALLFTQELSDSAIETLTNWFGQDSLHPLLFNTKD